MRTRILMKITLYTWCYQGCSKRCKNILRKFIKLDNENLEISGVKSPFGLLEFSICKFTLNQNIPPLLCWMVLHLNHLILQTWWSDIEHSLLDKEKVHEKNVALVTHSLLLTNYTITILGSIINICYPLSRLKCLFFSFN